MNVLLISANREVINMPTLPVGLACVAAAADQAGHRVGFLDLLGIGDVAGAVKEAVRSSPPGTIGISVRNIDDQTMEPCRFLLDGVREVVRICREVSTAPIVLGGAGYSIFPDSVLEYLGADLGIQGEGEVSFPMLLERLEKKQSIAGIPGVHLPGRKSPSAPALTRDLDELPFPDLTMFAPGGKSSTPYALPLQTRRGCPLDCNYCSTASIEGRLIRRRSPQAVVAKLSEWAKAGFNQVYFVDNTFNLPVSYALELCRRIEAEALGLDWRCILYPHPVTRELVASMARAGCCEVSLGFDSGCDTVLQTMHKRFDVKEVIQANRLLMEFGIRRIGFLLLGGPGETKKSVEESLSFADSLQLDILNLTVGVRIYPNTDLARRAVAEGRIAPDDSLLHPRFYLVDELQPWLRERVTQWAKERPFCKF
jgi:radical SAM superfamily enzyme YgiQ (UPF0313 family)